VSVLEEAVAALEAKLAEATATTDLWQYLLAGMGGGPHPGAPGQASVGEVHWQGLPTGRSSGPYRESSGGEGPGRLPPGLGPDPRRRPLCAEEAPVGDRCRCKN
jgi:hypothetical protein